MLANRYSHLNEIGTDTLEERLDEAGRFAGLSAESGLGERLKEIKR